MTPDRGIGALEAVDAALPSWAAPVAIGVTWLGSVPVLGAVVTARYWYRPRRETAVGVAVLLAAQALTVALKAFFSLPRPPATGWLVAVDGFGFPSGHAVTATAVWGYLAITVTRWPVRRRFIAVAVLVPAIALSRVALRVHYLVDVVAGILVGLALLAALSHASRRAPGRAFGLTAGMAVLAVLVGGGPDAALLLGAAIGGAAAWSISDRPPDEPDGRRLAVTVAIGGALAVILVAAFLGAENPVIALVAGGIVGGGILAAPTIAGRLR